MAVPDELLDKIRNISNLPTLPASAAILTDAMNDPTLSVRNIGNIAGQDPSLAAKVIRLANSSYYGIPKRITNVEDAAVVLGLRVMQALVLSMTVFDSMHGSRSGDSRKTIWKHSIATAAAGRLIAEKIEMPGVSPDDAFCAGLLHDIGKIAMTQYLRDDYERVTAVCMQSKEMSFHEAEKRILGYSHTDVFEWMTESWNLPDSLFVPVRYHHEPDEAPENSPEAFICNVADRIAHESKAVRSNEKTGAVPKIAESAMAKIGLSAESYDEIAKDLPKQLDLMRSFVEVIG